eukprot:5592148-Pyramimonas_sp.AAC.1
MPSSFASLFPSASRGDRPYMLIRSLGVPSLPSPAPACVSRQWPCLLSCGVSAAAWPTEFQAS